MRLPLRPIFGASFPQQHRQLVDASDQPTLPCLIIGSRFFQQLRDRTGQTIGVHGVLGRRIGTAPGYNYSSALRGMEIVWSTETISRLFEIGPNAYTPGTKMPEQTIGDAEDRAALMRFLDKATRQR